MLSCPITLAGLPDFILITKASLEGDFSQIAPVPCVCSLGWQQLIEPSRSDSDLAADSIEKEKGAERNV